MQIAELDLKNAIKLTGGISNDTYLVRETVYRQSSSFHDPQNRYIDEYRMIRALRNKPFIEKVSFYDKKNGLKISEYIKNTKYIDFDDEEQIIKAANIIQTIHQIKIAKLGKFNPFKRLKFYQKGLPCPLRHPEYIKIIDKAKELYRKYPLVTSHNDLVKSNFLVRKNEMFLLDYEFSGKNIELFDIASFLSENEINNEKTAKIFRDAFLVKYPDIDLTTMIQFLDLFWYYWALYRYKGTKKPIYLIIAKSKLENLKRGLKNEKESF